MKRKFVTLLLSFATYSATLFAQADLAAITGKYSAADGFEFENALKMKKKQKDDISVTFVGEADGKIQNLVIVKWKGGEFKAFLDEKLYNKKKVVWFKESENTLFELAPGVFAIANKDGSQVGDVLAKDKNQLKDFDIETAKALIDEKTSELKSDADDAALQKMMKFNAFKNNLEKVIFVDNKNAIFSAYGEPKEDPKVHIKSQVIGKPVWYNYYSKTNAMAKYGETAEINIEYEMEGVKKDRKSCAKLGRNWASSIPKVKTQDRYMFLNGRSFCDPSDKYYDYAFLSLMNDMNGKLLFGKSYNLKVTIYAYKDGANVGKLGEGVIAMKYEPESQAAMDLWKKWIEEM
jgi:hypothetical protein